MKFKFPVFLCGVLLLTLGCTAQQLYQSGQGWRQMECNKLVSQEETARCLETANTSYEKYQREREEAIKKP
jgi:hypothetical protein